MSFEFKITHQPNAAVFSISGRISQDDTTNEIMDSLVLELEKKVKFILLDISNLEYITSTGLNFFIRTLTKTRNAGGELIICGLQGMVEKLFVISKLNEIFTICPTIEAGLTKINAG